MERRIERTADVSSSVGKGLDSWFRRFDESGLSPELLFRIYEVQLKSTGSLFGKIHWSLPCHRWVFKPEANCVFDAECLMDIGAELNRLKLQEAR